MARKQGQSWEDFEKQREQQREEAKRRKPFLEKLNEIKEKAEASDKVQTLKNLLSEAQNLEKESKLEEVTDLVIYIKEKLKPPPWNPWKVGFASLGLASVVSAAFVAWQNASQRALEEAHEYLASLREKIASLVLQSRASNLQHKVDEDNLEIEENLDAQAETVQQIEQEKDPKQKTVLQSKYDRLYDTFQTQMRTLRTDRNQLNLELQRVKLTLQNKRSRINVLRREISQQIQDSGDAETLQEKLNEIKRLQADKNELLNLWQQSQKANQGKTQQIADLKTDIDAKKREIKNLQKQQGNEVQKLQNEGEDATALQTKLDDEQKKSANLRRAVDNLRKELKELHLKVGNNQRQINADEKEISDQKKEIAHLRARLHLGKTSKQEAAQLQKQINADEKRISDKEKEVAQLRQKLLEQKTASKQKAGNLQKQIDAGEKQASDQKKEIAHLSWKMLGLLKVRQTLQQKQTELGKLNTKLQIAKQDSETQQKEFNLSRENAHNLAQQLAGLESQMRLHSQNTDSVKYSALWNRYQELEKLLELERYKNKFRISFLASENRFLEQDLLREQTRGEQKQMEIKNLAIEVDALNAKLQIDKEVSKEQRKLWEKDLAGKQEEKEKLENDLARLKSQTDEKIQKLTNEKKELDKNQQRSEAVQDTIIADKISLESKVQNLTESVGSLKQELKDSDKQNKQTQKDLGKKEKQLTDAQAELREANSKLDKLQKASQAEIADLKTDITGYTNRLSDLQREKLAQQFWLEVSNSRKHSDKTKISAQQAQLQSLDTQQKTLANKLQAKQQELEKTLAENKRLTEQYEKEIQEKQNKEQQAVKQAPQASAPDPSDPEPSRIYTWLKRAAKVGGWMGWLFLWLMKILWWLSKWLMKFIYWLMKNVMTVALFAVIALIALLVAKLKSWRK